MGYVAVQGDILCSDYYTPSMLHAVFALVRDGILPLPAAVRMASMNPARAFPRGRRRGSAGGRCFVSDDNGLVPLMKAAAIEAATAAGALIRDGFGRRQDVDGRPAHDLKLSLDRRCEERILGVLGRSFPGHAVLSEEKGYEPGREPYVWIVDPLDGTVNFYHGLPHFCTSIACHELDPRGDAHGASLPDGRRIGPACVGVVFDPLREEMFVGAGEGQATLNGRPLAPVPVADLAEAVVVVSFGARDDSIPFMTRLLPRLTEEARKVRSLGSTALDIAQIAAGRIGAFIQRGTNLWDFAGAAAVVRAAGGIVDAEEFAPGRWRIIACNPGLYPRIKELVEE